MDYSNLRGRIRAKFKTQEVFAAAIGMHPSSLSKKLNDASEWTSKEIRRASDVLGILPEEIPQYFFCTER